MKITMTPQELNELINPNQERIRYLEQDLDEAHRENRELRQKLACSENPMQSHSSQIAHVMIAVSRFFTSQKSSTAEDLRYTLEELLPGQKLLQLKILREVTKVSLKDVKDFLEGKRYTLPSPTDDLDVLF